MINKLHVSNYHDYISGGAVKGIILISQFLLVPLFLSALGAEKYGEWLIIFAIPNYFMISDLGINQTVTNEICKLIVQKKFKEQEEIFTSAFSLLLLIGISLLFLFLLTTTIFDLKSILHITMFSSQEIVLILSFFLINVITFLCLRLLLGYFKAIDKFHKHEYYLFFIYVADILLNVVILYSKSPLYFIPMAMLLVRITFGLLTLHNLKKLAFFKFYLTKKVSNAYRILPASLSLTSFSIGNALLVQGFTIVIGVTLGPINIVIFNTVRTLTNSIKAFSSVLYLPSMPKFTILFSKDNTVDAFATFKMQFIRVALFTIVCSGLIFLLKDFILEIWLSTDLQIPNEFFGFMLISVIISTFWNTMAMVPFAVNNLKTMMFFPVVVASTLALIFYFKNLLSLKYAASILILINLIMLCLVAKSCYDIFILKHYVHFIKKTS